MSIAIIEQEALTEAVATARSVIQGRNTIPILNNVAMIFKNNKLSIMGTDLDCQVEVIIPADTSSGEFETTVDAGLFSRLIQQYAKGSEVKISNLEDKEIEISSGRNTSRLPTLPFIDYPSFDQIQWKEEFEIAGAALASILETVKPSVERNESRIHLTGIYLHNSNNELQAVATNGHTLCKSTVGYLPEGLENYEGLILPEKTTTAFIAASKKNEGMWQCSFSDQKVCFKKETLLITSKVIDATYPDYQRIIPEESTYSIKIDPSEFSKMLKRIMAISNEKTKGVVLTVEKETLHARTKKTDLSVANDSIECSLQNGDPGFSIGFNGEYLTTMLDNMSNSEALLEFTTARDPAKLSTENSTNISVISPMSIT